VGCIVFDPAFGSTGASEGTQIGDDDRDRFWQESFADPSRWDGVTLKL